MLGLKIHGKPAFAEKKWSTRRVVKDQKIVLRRKKTPNFSVASLLRQSLQREHTA